MFALTASLAGTSFANSRPAPLDESQFHPFNPAQAALGQLLFYDKILSGNRNISCGTCHHHDHASTDNLPLGIGEGGHGVGPERVATPGANAIVKRVPRNSPALFNLGHVSHVALFHDGRVSESNLFGNGFNSPAEEWLPRGLDTILSAQALFPLTAQAEMAGQPRENEVAGASNDRINYVWPILADRIRAIPQYRDLFVAAFEEIKTPADLTIVHIADALGAFMGSEWRSFDSPFDRYLAGEAEAMTRTQITGMDLFYGRAGCAECHSGPLLTDHGFYALALPHYGPGRTRMFDPYARDVGRMAESNALEDAYRFRTPSLRNVALTGPYGHNGAYRSLEGIIRHHLDPQGSFDSWTLAEVDLPHAPWLEAIDHVGLYDTRERARIRAAIDITPQTLTETEIISLIAFLEALTGDRSVDGRLGRPRTVPSGIPVD